MVWSNHVAVTSTQHIFADYHKTMIITLLYSYRLAIFLNEGNFVFGNASWNFFAPFSTNPSVANASESFLSSSWVSRITSGRRLLNRQTFFTCKYSKWVVFLQSSYHFSNRFLAQQDLRWTKRSVLLWGTVNVSHFFYSCSISCLVICVQEPF